MTSLESTQVTTTKSSQKHTKRCLLKVQRLARGTTEDFGTFAEVLQFEFCPVCSLIAHQLKHIAGVEAPLASLSIYGDDRCKIRNLSSDSLYLTIRVPRTNLRDDLSQLGFTVTSSRTEAPSLSSNANVSVTRPGRSPFLTTGVPVFLSHHGRNCVKKLNQLDSPLPASFRLVDVETDSIVPISTVVPYIALSYVWGSQQWLRCKRQNISILSQLQGLARLREEIPSTIIDAIELAKLLGFRYLWVDSLCIIQDDPSDLTANLSSMSAIYQSAQIVVVAAFGANADAGLPGIRTSICQRRFTTKSLCIDTNRTISTSLLDFRDVLWYSRWDERAWTMQEAFLSSTMLTCAASQAFLTCHCGITWNESNFLNTMDDSAASSNAEVTEDAASTFDMLSKRMDHLSEDKDWGDIGFGTYRNQDTMWGQYSNLVMGYTTRKLGNPADKLHAFQAILEYLQTKWSVSFWFGLPKSHFTKALLWRHSTSSDPWPLKRRDNIFSTLDSESQLVPAPSWSWVGWEGHVRYSHLPEYVHGPAWTMSSDGAPVSDESPLRQVIIQADVSIAFFHIDPEVTWNEYCGNRGHIAYAVEGSVKTPVAYLTDCDQLSWTSSRAELVKGEFIAVSTGKRFGDWWHRWGLVPRKSQSHGTNSWFDINNLNRGSDDDDSDDSDDMERADKPNERVPILDPDATTEELNIGDQDCVDAMFILRDENGIAYRSGITGMTLTSWKKGQPVEQRVYLA